LGIDNIKENNMLTPRPKKWRRRGTKKKTKHQLGAKKGGLKFTPCCKKPTPSFTPKER